MKCTLSSSTLGRLRAALLQDLAPSSPTARSRPPCLLCTYKTPASTKSPFHAPPRRHASTTTTPRKESLRPQTHYELFPQTLPAGPPPTGPFTIDTRLLRHEFLQLQARAHPDRHHGPDKARAEGASARINDAYKTLQSPLLRAQYLLRLRGTDVAGDETARVEDAGLLMEVMEMRERIEGAESEEEVAGMEEVNERRIGESVRGLEGAFARDDLRAAKEEAVRLRYWVNIRESLHAWERGKPVVLVH